METQKTSSIEKWFFLCEFRLNREKTYFHFRKLTYYWATYCWRLPIWHVFKYFEIVNREIYINFPVIFGVNLFALFCPRVISSARYFVRAFFWYNLFLYNLICPRVILSAIYFSPIYFWSVILRELDGSIWFHVL